MTSSPASRDIKNAFRAFHWTEQIRWILDLRKCASKLQDDCGVDSREKVPTLQKGK